MDLIINHRGRWFGCKTTRGPGQGYGRILIDYGSQSISNAKLCEGSGNRPGIMQNGSARMGVICVCEEREFTRHD